MTKADIFEIVSEKTGCTKKEAVTASNIRHEKY